MLTMNISTIDLRSRVNNIRKSIVRRSLPNILGCGNAGIEIRIVSVLLSTTDKTLSPNYRDDRGMKEQRLYLHLVFIANSM